MSTEKEVSTPINQDKEDFGEKRTISIYISVRDVPTELSDVEIKKAVVEAFKELSNRFEVVIRIVKY